jgi:SecD/SecF fusion protein
MEKRKRWHLWLIVAVLGLTAYNILPTIFFYTKPLDKPVGPETATKVAVQISDRVNALQGEAVSWVDAYARNLGLKPESVLVVTDSPDLIAVTLPTSADAAKFRKFLPRAGALIPFAPAQLQLGAATPDQPNNVVIVERAIAAQLAPPAFTFSEKLDADGTPTPLYQEITSDRMIEVGLAVGGESMPAQTLRFAPSGDAILALAGQIVEYEKVFGLESPLTKRFYASFTQSPQPGALVSTLKRGLRTVSGQLEEEISKVEGGANEGVAWTQNVRALRRQKELTDRALDIVEGQNALFEAGATPLTAAQIAAAGDVVELGKRNTFFESLTLDWDQEKMVLVPHADLRAIQENRLGGELAAYRAEKLDQLLVNEVADLGRETDEQVRPEANGFAIALNALTGSKSFTVLDLSKVATQKIGDVERRINTAWNPTSADLSRTNFPLWDYATYSNLSADLQQLGLVVYAPALDKGTPKEGFRTSSIYVIARGLGAIAEKGKGGDQSALMTDVNTLGDLLKQEGFVSFMDGNDLIFQLDNYYADVLAATREKFEVHGTKRYAVLEYTDQKQRLLTLNAIQTAQHEDLVKWRDEYHTAKIKPDLHARYDVPPPTKSVLWSNLALSAKKYFRGDDRKVLNWGLDLSGGKTVTIGLVDQRNRPVTDPADLRQGINELTSRVNKMGVSEVEVRQEGNNIVLNFPGAQGLSASELIKASTMTFHIVNEQFGLQNQALAGSVSRFLQEVWNEAVVTGRNSIDQINEIAFGQLGGAGEEEGSLLSARSEAAQTLWNAGLRLADPRLTEISSAFDDELSAVAMWRGDSYAEWQDQPNPLLFVFANYALEGTSLEGVQAQYDPSKGNMLVFSVKGSATSPDGFGYNPRDEFYTWTSQFAKTQISGTPKAAYSRDQGWRMAAILNGEVISAPTLNDALRANAQVTGHFSQREVNQLVADLKAGSLSFTPKILSEKNVSPDLGKQERTQGIVAAIVGLLLVIGGMAWYYRFAGLIAGCAVVINLLIIWGVLQNLDAALTLPGIAGIILTVGMAVDANVLVFERIREEFAVSKRIGPAISAGYKKAFSAIVDSNITTILAAFILLHFDAGPIKAFAVTIIIGIVSSMFTALFMTRFFFAGWVQKPKNTELKMTNLFHQTNFDFLGKAKIAITGALLVIIAGGGLLWMQRNTMFGMDFTGGYALNVTVEERADGNYRTEAIAALTAAGAPAGDVLVRQLNRPNQLRIQLGRGLEQPGRPFYGLPQETPAESAVFLFETNPRIVWTVDALAVAGLEVSPDQLPTLQNQWNVISGQFSDTMRNSALWGLGLALLSILVYITVRFEFKYAISAIVALAHDVLITVGAMAILHKLHVGVQIDLQVVGALMTIVGYSLNDTIVIFDRVREDSRVLRKLSFRDMVNSALNSTLNRTLITSGTTLLVLIALVLFGGAAIFDFALVMTMGVVFGTFSSLFIASPVLLFFHKREMAREEQVTSSAKRA